MGFKAVKNDGGLMKAGDYECYLKSCGYSVTKNGNECIKFDFVVREDVEQEYQKKHIFKNFWPDRDTGEYDADKIGKYANALGIEPGTDFELDDLVGRNCILHMEPFEGNDGVTCDCIRYLKPSKADSFVTPAPASAEEFKQLDESDDELPF